MGGAEQLLEVLRVVSLGQEGEDAAAIVVQEDDGGLKVVSPSGQQAWRRECDLRLLAVPIHVEQPGEALVRRSTAPFGDPWPLDASPGCSTRAAAFTFGRERNPEFTVRRVTQSSFVGRGAAACGE